MLKSQMKGYVETRGAKPFDYDRKKFAQYLLSLAESEIVLTNYMRHRLEDEGYITVVPDEPNGSRGRPAARIDFTTKARPFLATARAARTRENKRIEAEKFAKKQAKRHRSTATREMHTASAN